MQPSTKLRRSALRAIAPCALLALSIGLSGCHWWKNLEPGENLADKIGAFAGFCGFLQNCGGNGNSNMGNQAASDSDDTSDSDGGSSGGGSTGEGSSEGARAAE